MRWLLGRSFGKQQTSPITVCDVFVATRTCLMVMHPQLLGDAASNDRAVLMDDLITMPEAVSVAPSFVDGLLLALDDDSESEGEEDDDPSAEAGARTVVTPPNLGASRTKHQSQQMLAVHTGLQLETAIGDAYDIAPSCKAQQFVPALQSIAELQSDEECEDREDEDELPTPPDDAPLEADAMPSLPPQTDVQPVPQCESLALVDATAPADAAFGSELKRVASRRNEILASC